MGFFDSLLRRRRPASVADMPAALTFELRQAGYTYQGEGISAIGLKPSTLRITERRVAVIGLNGSGKTTLLKLLDGALAANTGSVAISARDEQLDPGVKRENKRVQELVGRVRREEIPPAFNRAKSVREALDRWLYTHRISEQQANVTIANLLAHFSLAEVAEHPVAALDGEQRHLLAIVAVLGLSPVTIVADEPTKGLDERGTSHVAKALFDYGKQVIFATHDISMTTRAEYGIERVLVLDAQSIVFDGAPSDAVIFYDDLMRRKLEAAQQVALSETPPQQAS